MPSVETYYLVDFENVQEDGLSGSENLGSHDHVHLFSTKNVPKISIETLTRLNSADLSSHAIPAGKQSLDMHLVSFLGYLIGININNKCRYVIVSKDTNYDNIIAFWKNQKITDITRQNTIADDLQTKAQPTTAKTSETTNINNEIQKILSKADFNNDIISYVASLISKHHNEQNAKQTIYRAIVAKYGQNQGLNIYNHIKKNI